MGSGCSAAMARWRGHHCATLSQGVAAACDAESCGSTRAASLGLDLARGDRVLEVVRIEAGEPIARRFGLRIPEEGDAPPARTRPLDGVRLVLGEPGHFPR